MSQLEVIKNAYMENVKMCSAFQKNLEAEIIEEDSKTYV